MLVEVIHPVPVRHFPKGARKSRLTHVADRTPVDLVTVSEGEMEPVGHGDCEGPGGTALGTSGIGRLALHGGEAWHCLTRWNGGGGDLTPERFVNLLSGGDGPEAVAALGVRFQRSPLVAHTVLESRSANGQIDQATRGEDFDDALQRQVVSDGRGAHSARIADFMRDEFRLAPDAVWARFRPTARPDAWSNKASLGSRAVIAIGGYPPVNAWSLEGAAEAWGTAPEGIGDVAATLRGLPPRPDCVDDIVRMANWAAVKARPHTVADAGMFGRRSAPGRSRALEDALMPLLEFEQAGMYGAIGPEDAFRVLRLAAKAFEAYAGCLVGGDHLTGKTGRLGAYVATVVEPRMRERLERDRDAQDLMRL